LPTPQWLLRIARINDSCPSAPVIESCVRPERITSGAGLEDRWLWPMYRRSADRRYHRMV